MSTQGTNTFHSLPTSCSSILMWDSMLRQLRSWYRDHHAGDMTVCID
jgi:hypothetical protein